MLLEGSKAPDTARSTSLLLECIHVLAGVSQGSKSGGCSFQKFPCIFLIIDNENVLVLCQQKAPKNKSCGTFIKVSM